MSLPCRRALAIHFPLFRSLHTNPSRTRLVKDLTPRSKNGGKLEVATPTFSRGTPPHSVLRPKQERPTGFSVPKPSAERLARRNHRRLRRLERKGETRGRALPTQVTEHDLSRSSRHAPGPRKEFVASGAATKVTNPLAEEFDFSPSEPRTSESLPTSFSSPPLLEGLRDSVHHILGQSASPTPIQALSLKHLISDTQKWRQYLLASETGSGKSIAYLLPMLHDLKASELASSESTSSTAPLQHRRAVNPRALILAPTHELSRQLASFAKALLHNVKLKVLCASRANTKSTPRSTFTASKMAAQFADDPVGNVGAFHSGASRPTDVLVGTPNKLLELARGRRWNRVNEETNEWPEPEPFESRNDSPFKSPEPEMGLQNVEWVIVDEADILFDPDFQESTRTLLADVAAAKGQPVENTMDPPHSPETLNPSTLSQNNPINYPFNFILTTATIPSSLATYLDTYHPTLTRLASPKLHRLPSTMKTEYENWTGGNKNADIERRIRKVWADDSIRADFDGQRSKILIFCNKGTKVESLGAYLEDKGIPNVALTKDGKARNIGNNHHLEGFLRTTNTKPTTSSPSPGKDNTPHVMITTSMLSRGLDFSPDLRNVFIVDEPRNMVDFLHRAGRSARAGHEGKVVVFGKLKGRGSAKTTEMKKKVGALRR